MVKIILSGYDGTLLFGSIEKNIKAVHKWRAAGRKFGIITGRSLDSMQRQLAKYPLEHDYMGLNNGAVMVDGSHNIFYYQTIHFDLAWVLADFLTKLPVDEVTFWGVTGSKMHSVPYDTTKISMKTANFEQAKQVAKQLSDMFSDRFIVTPMAKQADNYGYIEIVPEDTGKERAAARILSREGLGGFEVAIIGEAYDELEMIKKYSGYAVDNATPEVKAVATRIFLSVADLIDELIAED
ncbi:MAG: Cof-type HAD-IIB family hydrolase [Candidatus Nomurabacteria bacterium]|jgi:hydroxymethylpyrimidine pyrophosphatase-like HAD family hydrolase|nr:Cof-type HAD-IIB family hydrolase [Candidatus Nomurabacteria bacterium]